jgi:hypothetical protein
VRPRRARAALPALVAAVLTLAGLVPAAVVGSTPAAATTVPVPATPQFVSPVDRWATYTSESTCSPTAKPGPVRLRTLLRATYKTTSDNIVRPCTSAISGHEEGRALDWMRSVAVPAQRAQVSAFLGWLLAPDPATRAPAVNARRMGIVYLIWNHYQWSSYARYDRCNGRSYPAGAWSPYCGSVPHTDHVHFSFSWDGAWARTSWYTGWPYLGCEGSASCPETRLAAADRYAESALVARSIPAGGPVVLASGADGHLSDGLVAAPFARHLGAPLLLTTSTTLPPSVAAEITRRHATEAWLVGSGGALGDALVDALTALGVPTVHRVSGADPVELSAAVARQFGTAGSALVAPASAAADAVPAVGPAGSLGQPLLLVPSTGLPSATAQVIADLGVTSTLAVGSTSALPDALLAQLPAPTRVSGPDRYAIGATLSVWYAARLPHDDVQVLPVADAGLADTVSALATGRLTLVSTPTTIARQTGLWLSRHPELARGYVVGGPTALSPLVAGQVAGIIAAT